MKKLLFFSSFLFILAFFVLPVHAETIRSFDSTIAVQTDGKIRVTERINYDFENSYKHGIYRSIPFITKNTQGKEYKLDITINSVRNEHGSDYPYTTSTEGDFLRLQIGDAHKTITGVHVYTLDYTVSGALTYFSEHDELYWNSTGSEWSVDIEKATTEIHLPDTIPPESITSTCYTGTVGSSARDCIASAGATSQFSANSPLVAGSGLTIVVGFPKGKIAILEPKEYIRFENTPFGKFVMQLLGVVLAIIAVIWYLLLPVYIPIRWWQKGRDPSVAEVRVWYDPPKSKEGRQLSPAETGSLIDETVDMRDIFASIVQLAQRGYLQIIEEKKNEFVLVKKKEWDGKKDIVPFESLLLSGLFADGDKLKIKGAELSSPMSKVTDSLYGQMVSDEFFKKNPQTTRTIYYAIAGVALFTGNILLAIVLFIFAKRMPAKTLLGAEQASVARSLKTFLSSQERQLEFQAKNQLMFEKLLPYAIAFGVEKIWADRFKDISLMQPSWYVGYNNTAFNAIYFASVMHSSVGSFQASATPTSSSTGQSSGFSGGFSGGGGGGGGGGSW